MCSPQSGSIVSPSVLLCSWVKKGPLWSDVRRVHAREADLQMPNGIRMHAVLCLAAIYALRSVEGLGYEIEQFRVKADIGLGHHLPLL